MTTYASDSFNRANGAIGTADDGGAWTLCVAGTTVFNVVSNQAKLITDHAATNTDVAFFDPGVGDVEISVDIGYLTATNVGLVTRFTPHTSSATINLILVNATGGTLKLYRCTNGTYTQVGSAGGTLTNGNTYNVKVTVSGNTFNVYLDGALVIGPQTITQHAGVTKHGIISYNDKNTTFDNFLITNGAFVTGTVDETLDPSTSAATGTFTPIGTVDVALGHATSDAAGIFTDSGSPAVVDESAHGGGTSGGGNLIWPADTIAAPARPKIPVFIRPEPIGKPKKVLEYEDEELLLLLGAL